MPISSREHDSYISLPIAKMCLSRTFTEFYNNEFFALEICCCGKGVHSIKFMPKESFNVAAPNIVSNSNKVSGVMKNVIEWLKSYFDSSVELIRYMPPICPSVTSNTGAFTNKVWKILKTQVPFGNTISYGQLASLCNSDKASRAVGSAMKKNPIPLIIPCHRVIKSNGKIGHFSAGINIKQWLLKHEKASYKT